MEYLTTSEVAKDLGLSKITVQKYCQTGFLPANLEFIKGNKVYLISSTEFFKWKSKHFSGLKKGQIKKSNSTLKELSLSKIQELSEIWLDWCKTGKLTGKPLAPRTIEIYKTYLELYLKSLGAYPTKPIISVNNLREVLGSFAPERFSTKRNIYDAVMSLSKYLSETNLIDESIRIKMKTLKPKRYIPAKKSSVTEDQLKQIYKSIDDSNNNCYAKLLNKTIVCFLANTGLRASEFCRLKLEDVNLEERRVYVWLGKGNKNRIVGISSELYKQLIEYLKTRLKMKVSFDNFFLSNIQAPFDVKSIGKKVRRITEKAGLKNISPHSLRRSFVTINSGKGKSLNHLRIACGHADITTTQSYCMTSVDEVVEAMKGW